jgi:hypothetical protein
MHYLAKWRMQIASEFLTVKRRPCGGRKRENMTVAEEKALLARFAKAAGAGEMLNIHDLGQDQQQHGL